MSKLEGLTSTKEKEVGGGRVNDGSASFVKQRGKRKFFLYVRYFVICRSAKEVVVKLEGLLLFSFFGLDA